MPKNQYHPAEEDRMFGLTHNSVWASAALGALMGFAIFLYIWGASPLNIYNWDFVLHPAGTDLCFTSIAARTYLSEPWSWPPGYIQGIVYPAKTSILFVDGIPAAAFIAKIASKILGQPVQYFGLWSLFCFGMQGALAAFIIRKYSRSALVAAIGAVFFFTAPFLLGKTFGHASMSGQWLILAAIALIVYRDHKFVQKHDLKLFTLLIFSSVGVLTYFTPMLVLLELGYLAIRVFEVRTSAWRLLWQHMSVIVCSAIVAMAIFGGFVPGHDSSGGDYGLAPMNWNALFNPIWLSATLRGWPEGRVSGEALMWIGLGLFLGLILAVFNIILRGPARKHSTPLILTLCVVSFGLLLFAATHHAMLGNIALYNIDLPQPVLNFLSIFRTSARFGWPVWYLIAFFVLIELCSMAGSTKRAAIALLILSAIQISDSLNLKAVLNLSHLNGYHSAKDSADEFTLLKAPFKHLVFYPRSGMIPHHAFATLADQALQHQITTSCFWMGRYPNASIQSQVDTISTGLAKGQSIPEDTLLAINLLSVLGQVSDLNTLCLLKENGVFFAINPKSITSQNSGKVLSLKKSVLSEFLQESVGSHRGKYVVISARDRNPVVIEPKALANWKALGLSAPLIGANNYNYLAVINPEGNIVEEQLSPSPITLNKSFASIGNAPLDLKANIDVASGAFPELIVYGTDISASYMGLAVYVIDPATHTVERTGLFDLYHTGPGLQF